MEVDDRTAGCNQYAFGKEVASFANLPFFFKDTIAQHFYRETVELNTALLTGVHNKVGESLNSSALSMSIRVRYMQAFLDTDYNKIADKFICPVIVLFFLSAIIRHRLLDLCSHLGHEFTNSELISPAEQCYLWEVRHIFFSNELAGVL